MEGNHRQPFTNQYQERKKRKHKDGGSENSWAQKRRQCGKSSNELKDLAAQASSQVQSLQKDINELQKLLRTVAGNENDKSQSMEGIQLQDSVSNRQKSDNIKRKLCYSRQQLKPAKQEKYHWDRLQRTRMPDSSWTASSSTITSKPSHWNPATLDDTDHTDLSLLMMGETAIAFAGVDPGLVTTEETVGISPSRLFTHINRYAPLANPDDDIDMDSMDDPVAKRENIESIKLPDSRKTKASTLNHACHSQSVANRRERRLRKAPDVRTSTEVVADATKVYKKDPSPQNLDVLQPIRRACKPKIRGFENSKSRMKDRHHLAEQSRIAKSITAATIRQSIKNCKWHCGCC
jgi:hypothetical protein